MTREISLNTHNILFTAGTRLNKKNDNKHINNAYSVPSLGCHHYPKIYFLGISDKQKAEYAEEEAKARKARSKMPLWMQAMYPATGSIGLNFIDNIDKQVKANPIQNEIYNNLNREDELNFIKQYSLLRKLSCSRKPYERCNLAASLIDINDSKLRDSLIIKLSNDDNMWVKEDLILSILYMYETKKEEFPNKLSTKLLCHLIKKFSNDNDYAVQTDAARLALCIGHPDIQKKVIEDLANNAKNENIGLKQSVGFILPRITDPVLFKQVIEKCFSDEKDEDIPEENKGMMKIGLAQSLWEIEDPELQEYLFDKLSNDANPEVRRMLPFSAVRIENIERRKKMLDKLAIDSDDVVKRNIIVAIRDIKDKLSFVDMFVKLSISNKDIKGYVAAFAGEISNPATRDKVIKNLFNDEDEEVKCCAAASVWNVSDPALFKSIIEFSKDKPLAKICLIHSLPKFKDINLRDKLIEELLNDEEVEVRLEFANVIDEIDDDVLRNRIIDKLSYDKNEDVRRDLASYACRTSDIDRLGGYLTKFSINPDKEVRRIAALHVCKITDPDLRNEIIEVLKKDNNSEVIGGLEQSLARLNIPEINMFSCTWQYMGVMEDLAKKFGLEDIIYPADLIYPQYVVNMLGKDAGELSFNLNDYSKLFVNNVKKPERFGNAQQPFTAKDMKEFFLNNGGSILTAIMLLGYEPVQLAFDKKKWAFEEFISFTDKVTRNDEDFKLIKDLCNMDKRMKSKDKIDLIYIYNAYKEMKMDTSIFNEMLKSKNIDINLLKKGLLKGLLKVCSASENNDTDIPENVNANWNIEYIHLLANSIEKFKNKDLLIAIIKSTIEGTYDDFLHNSPEVGEINLQTKKAYEEAGLDYDEWLKFKPEEPVTVSEGTISPQEKFQQIKDQLMQNLDILIQNEHIRKFLEKKNYKFDGNKLIIKPSILDSTKLLKVYVANLSRILSPAWERAWKNQNEENRKILAIERNLKITREKLDEAEKIPTEPFNLEIKLWDRNPGYDLFQGHYSHCCVAVDSNHKETIVDYLAHTAVQIIEFKDQKHGNTVGNAFCFMAKNNENKPIMIIDNIEMAPGYKGSKEVQKGIIKFAKLYSKAVTKGIDIPIYLGKEANDIPELGLPEKCIEFELLGKLTNDELYLDILNDGTVTQGNIEELNTRKTANLFELV